MIVLLSLHGARKRRADFDLTEFASRPQTQAELLYLGEIMTFAVEAVICELQAYPTIVVFFIVLTDGVETGHIEAKKDEVNGEKFEKIFRSIFSATKIHKENPRRNIRYFLT